ncbi:MAG TPA: SxtJ family membrane protein [Bradyrhizobium sp.]|uniref:SxtJ family membrane protein n=1 Tax=Bradyrhizobium sp. TaxID=376 RepID=UPI002B7BE642|nr:SxtJ family membrane protein [Bradyrhizobium sp.]HTA99052.1 SxtJ family membrane protein [Bradyrhizobium sp.]
MIDGKYKSKPGQSTHEVFSRDEKIVAGSDRSFGLVMAAAFAAVSLLNAWHSGRLWPWTGGLAALLLAAGLFRPAVLHPLNLIWLRFGLLLNRVVSPIVMALLFYGTVLPTGLVMRMFGKDPLRLKRQPDADSYWIVRQPPGPSPETMRDQF